MLFLVATPIGNLKDISFRALEILQASDYILAEDTRHSLNLLNHYNIKKTLKSYHKFSEAKNEEAILEDLKKGLQIALISDAGTPGISDPGERLVKKCQEEGIVVQSIPGAAALIVALSASGLSTHRFQFCGFLPKKESEVSSYLQEILPYPGTTIFYQSPKRLLAVLRQLERLAPLRKIVVARELTKKFEEIKMATASQHLEHFTQNEIKGEIVLLIEGQEEKKLPDFLSLSPEEHVHFLVENYKLSKNEAIKMAATLRGVPKRDIYNKLV